MIMLLEDVFRAQDYRPDILETVPRNKMDFRL
jgi:hypothetical protein